MSGRRELPFHKLSENVKNLEELPEKFKLNSFANYWIIGVEVEQQRANNVAADQSRLDQQKKKDRINHLLNANNQGGFVERFFQNFVNYNKHYYQNELSAMELRWKFANLHLHAEFMKFEELQDWVKLNSVQKEKKSSSQRETNVLKVDELLMNNNKVGDVKKNHPDQTEEFTTQFTKSHPEKMEKAEEESNPTINSSPTKQKLTPGNDYNQQIENIASQERKKGKQMKYLPPQRRQGAEFTAHHTKSDSEKVEEKLAEKSHSTISSSPFKSKRMENQMEGIAPTRKALISSFDWISAQGDQLKASQSESKLTSRKDNDQQNGNIAS